MMRRMTVVFEIPEKEINKSASEIARFAQRMGWLIRGLSRDHEYISRK